MTQDKDMGNECAKAGIRLRSHLRDCFNKANKATERGTPSGQAEFVCSIASVDDLAILVRRLARQLRKHDPKSYLATKAVDYLNRHNLKSSPLKQ